MRANVNWKLDGVLDGNKHRKLSLPLPSEVDLADLAFLPLFDRHLIKSRAWLQAKSWRGEGPGLAFCIMNLWIGALRATPAGSLEDDNNSLADVANVSIEHWKKMRTQALRGWVRIEKRLWHPAICQIAWSLWMARVQSRHFKVQDASRSSGKRALERGVEPPCPTPPYEKWLLSEYPETHAYITRQLDLIRPAARQPSPTDNSENPMENRAKLSKANYSPLTPPFGYLAYPN